jgi:hypothetical protein
MWIIAAGGVPVLFVIAFGLIGLATAARFAWSPGDGRIGHVAGICTAVAFASLAGFAADLMTVSVQVTGSEEWSHSPDLPLIVLAGFGEAMSPLILGFSLVAVTALVTAIGLRRAPALATAGA